MALLIFLLLALGAGLGGRQILTQSGARAAAGPADLSGLESGGSGRVVAVVDGDTLVLDDGREVRLVGIQAPKLPLGRKAFKTWPLAREAKDALEALTLGRQLDLAFGGRRGDRHGRILAHLSDAEGRWIQGEMLSQGMARVYSFFDNRALVPELLAREAEARTAGLGIWGHPFYALRTPEALSDYVGRFEIVEGRVLSAAVTGRRGFLNFGEDWKQDFTVTLDAQALRRFAEAGLNLTDYEGRWIRVRGWVKSYNGPNIEVTHPEQIEWRKGAS